MEFEGSINNCKVTAEVGVVSQPHGCIFLYTARVGFVFSGNGDGVLFHLKPAQGSSEEAWEHAKRCMEILGFTEVDTRPQADLAEGSITNPTGRGIDEL